MTKIKETYRDKLRQAYCPKCRSTEFFDKECMCGFPNTPCDDFRCLKCKKCFTDKELNEAFINLRKDPEYATKGRSYTSESEENMQQTPETGALKFDTDKPRMELLDVYAMEQIAAVLTYGAKKYTTPEKSGEHNWRQGFKWSRLIGAALRHLTAFARGEDKDPESGLSHLAHAGCCIMFLLYHEKAHQALDDRFKYEVK